MSRRLRVFIAVPIDASVRARAVAVQQRLADTGADVRWVDPGNLHLTLIFLGEVDELDVVSVCRVVQAVAGERPSFDLSFRGIDGFPNLRRPRTLYLSVAEGAAELVALHEALEGPLLDTGCYRRESRPFTPHLTLGRLSGEIAEPLRTLLSKRSSLPGGQMTAREVVVYQSEWRSTGPEYTVLSRVPLDG